MIVLALDTSTREGSCAIARDDEVREEPGDAGRSHAEQLPLSLMTLLDRNRLSLADIDLFAVATGPGSFTGLRVGIAAMQGLAFATAKPLIGVSSLDALAAIAESNYRGAGAMPDVATWIDAWRGEIYAALYSGGRQLEAPTVEPPAAVLGRLRGRPPLLIGDGVPLYADLIRRILPAATIAEPPAPLLAGTVARLAMASARAGQHPAPDAIRPLYVRRSDAEISRDARAI
ncbi:MAG TPA: tRNA (adenosine(37)-N6)-threonylcarbamoyltransferase complex dimerization subunit type 1 TsaB [Vicinamibacterales bacterium]|nr:tRNA (adenosine(37)-N6)-threonylcarbamoyltransferase complex dimerization subunit type 1 TsaB [Vicinamibacterales bacterium]